MIAAAGSGSLRLAPKPGTVALQDGAGAVYALDGEGRLFAASARGLTYRRGFDNRVMEKRLPDAATAPAVPWRRRRRTLGAEEAREVLDALYEHLRSAAPVPPSDPGRPLWPGGPDLGDWWERVRGWDAAGLEADAGRFRGVYAPVGILPPDMYLSVVVQATAGCSYNRCAFCDLYRDVPFRVRPSGEFGAHLDAVAAFFGAALAGRRWLFVGEGNALALPTERLEPLLRQAAERWPVAPPHLEGARLRAWLGAHAVGFAGLAGFLDAPGGRGRPAAEWAGLRALGLRRAHIGLETGHEPLRRFLRKPGSGEDVRRAVGALRAGGVGVALIVLVGAGGRRFADGHVRDTLRLLDSLDLGPQDLVYLSPFVERPGAEYAGLAAAEGVEALDEAGVARQYRRFVGALRRPSGPRVAVYDIGEFVY